MHIANRIYRINAVAQIFYFDQPIIARLLPLLIVDSVLLQFYHSKAIVGMQTAETNFSPYFCMLSGIAPISLQEGQYIAKRCKESFVSGIYERGFSICRQRRCTEGFSCF